MPELGGKSLTKNQQPALYKSFLKSALAILKGEQLRLGAGGKEESDALVNEIMAWAYNLEPFRSHPWNVDTKPLDFWKGLKRDSNARQIAVSYSCC